MASAAFGGVVECECEAARVHMDPGNEKEGGYMTSGSSILCPCGACF